MWNPFKYLTLGDVILFLSDHWTTYPLSSQHSIYALDLFLSSFNLSSVCVSSSSAKSEIVLSVFISGSVSIFTSGPGGIAKPSAIVITTSTKCLHNSYEEKWPPPSYQAWWYNSHPNTRYQMRICSFTVASLAVSLPSATSSVSHQQGEWYFSWE